MLKFIEQQLLYIDMNLEFLIFCYLLIIKFIYDK